MANPEVDNHVALDPNKLTPDLIPKDYKYKDPKSGLVFTTSYCAIPVGLDKEMMAIFVIKDALGRLTKKERKNVMAYLKERWS